MNNRENETKMAANKRSSFFARNLAKGFREIANNLAIRTLAGGTNTHNNMITAINPERTSKGTD
jgi:hypothetical protein